VRNFSWLIITCIIIVVVVIFEAIHHINDKYIRTKISVIPSHSMNSFKQPKEKINYKKTERIRLENKGKTKKRLIILLSELQLLSDAKSLKEF